METTHTTTTITYGNRTGVITAEADGTFSVRLEDAITVANFTTFGDCATYTAEALGSIKPVASA